MEYNQAFLRGILGALMTDKILNNDLIMFVLDSSFFSQIAINNSTMLEAYDELQCNVILMKVDMLHALSRNIYYLDADTEINATIRLHLISLNNQRLHYYRFFMFFLER